MSLNLTEIQNFRQISNLLFTSGQPKADQFTAIQAAGCVAVINLAHRSSPEFIENESEIVEGLWMYYHAIPVEWESPKAENVEQFFGAMRKYPNQPVFVHCARNKRASCFTYLYRVLELNEPREAALADLHAVWQPEPVWQALIDQQLAVPA